MKVSSYFFTVVFLISFTAIAQKEQPANNLKKLLKEYSIKISDTSLMSKYEVSNKLYNLFLNDLRKSDNEKYLRAKIDTSKWSNEKFGDPGMAKYYHSHPSYGNFPVVNISYDGAVLFCKWMKEKLPEITSMKIKEVRLPNAGEWEAAAKGNNPEAIYSWPGTKTVDEKGTPYGQFKGSAQTMQKPGKLNEAWPETAPVDSFKPNATGLYNMCGNVAEMLLEKGKTKGGAWNSSADYLKINGPDEFADFTEPSPFIGFRYIIILDK